MWGAWAEAVVTLFLEVLSEVGLQSAESRDGKPLPLWVRLIIYALLGAVLGLISLMWWPAGGRASATIRTMAMVLAPVLAAWLLIRWGRQQDSEVPGLGVNDKLLRALALLVGLATMRALAH